MTDIFEIDGVQLGYIHRDNHNIPYLLIIDEQGNAWRIYGYAQVDGMEVTGEWKPGKHSMARKTDNNQATKGGGL